MSKYSILNSTAQERQTKESTVTITGGGASVSGYMKDKFIYNMTANYEQVMNGVISLDDIARKTLNIVGMNGFNAGIWSRKFFSGGSHIMFDINIRIVDENATGTVLNAVKAISNMMCPKIGANNTSIGNLASAIQGETKTVVNAGINLASKGAKAIGFESLGSAIASTSGFANRAINDAISSSPSEVNLEIQGMVNGLFLIEGFTPTIYMEKIINDDTGMAYPLMADMQIRFSSAEAFSGGDPLGGSPSIGYSVTDSPASKKTAKKSKKGR